MSDAAPKTAAAFIGLGSNLGDRLQNLLRALSLMEPAGIRVTNKSSVYETDPVGPPQPPYLNAVFRVETDLTPGALLDALKQIEQQMGRLSRERWGPREIDLDLLLYEDQVIASEQLTIPHPELTNRPFMLIPLLEIDSSLRLPSGVKAADLLPVEPPGVRPYPQSVL